MKIAVNSQKLPNGEEKALKTLRSLEGANINKSLLALSSCINALVEGKKHIPFRNSKLTQLLKDSLGGCCNTVMIANISPSNLTFSETQNTLHWVDRAKEIRLKECDVNEEVKIPDSGEQQAKLLLELQKENRELRIELARQQQKLLVIQAQALAATSSPVPSTISSFLSPVPSSGKKNEKSKPRPSFNYFTPESKKKATPNETMVKDLTKIIKAHDTEIEKIKKEHVLQIKLKDDYICQLSRKVVELRGGVCKEGVSRILTRSRTRPKEPPQKSPSHRMFSPAPSSKKRSFWDITANSPSVNRLTGRWTRCQFVNGQPAPSVGSLLLQPGFASEKTNTLKR